MKILIALLPSLATASVAADPLLVDHGPTPTFWAELVNDDLVGRCGDDHLTAGFRSGLCVDKLVVGLEYDMLTDRPHLIRSDEISLSIGRQVLIDDLYGVICLGEKATGNEGGQAVQDWWHRVSSNEHFGMDYEGGREWRTFILADLRYQLVRTDDLTGAIEPAVQFTTDIRSCTAVASLRFLHTDVIGESTAWYFIAPTFTQSVGKQPSQTAAAVSRFYNQPSIMYGLRADSVLIDFNVGIKGAYGEIGFCF